MENCGIMVDLGVLATWRLSADVTDVCRCQSMGPLYELISAYIGTDLQDTRPLENLTSADVSNYRCRRMPCQVFPFEISHRPMSVLMLQDATSS